MEVDNTIYEKYGHAWWDENAGFEFSSLRYCVNPVRYRYFKTRLKNMILPDNTVLDIGCGGGFLSEQFAADGFDVTGIDPSAVSVAAAREHASRSNLTIQYHVGRGESLPFATALFSVVACCDVLEHVDSVADVIREAARTLRPGGVFLYDTINRTLKSKILMIKVWQDWGVAGVSEHAHVWEKFIRPDEITEIMSAHGLASAGMMGMSSAKNPLSTLYALHGIRSGRTFGHEVGRAFPMRETDDLSVSYMGWAIRK